ncbi:MAG: HIT domain-containing protein [Patescibacteria group bacterium]|jgi:histidine triad (HIT) family protein
MDANCIFCNIINGKIDSNIIYEDDKFLGFLDINPLTKGNSLLVPKTHFRWVYDVPNFGDYWETAKRIAMSTKEALLAESVSFLTLGYEVPHAHIRIIPRYPQDSLHQNFNLEHKEDISKDKMLQIANSIKDTLK